jgi:hypothetical protein
MRRPIENSMDRLSRIETEVLRFEYAREVAQQAVLVPADPASPVPKYA